MIEERESTREVDVPQGSSVAELARRIGVPVESAVFLIDDRPVPTDETLSEGCRVRVVSAVSGG